jgi:GT2 family glycosyltransferase
MNKKVGIIMVGYADYVNRFLLECRDSLREQDYDNFQVYIIDNCSINDCEFSKKHYPEAISVHRDDGNYAAANNLGMKMALDDGCEYLVIANMDTKFKKDWLSELVRAIESDEKIGIAQSKMLLYPKDEAEWKKSKINSTGNIMHFLGFGFTKDYNREDYDIEGLPEIEGYASGCSFITKKEVIEKVGMENEDLWMYHDDVEFSWKVKLAGYKIVLAPKSVMYHKYEFGRSILMLYYMERNRTLVMLYFYRIPTLILLLPAIVAMDLGMTLYSIPGKWFKTKMRVFGYYLKPSTWIQIARHRKEVRKFRVVNDREIVKNFEGRVLFQEIENPVLKYIANPIFNAYWQIVKYIIVW